MDQRGASPNAPSGPLNAVELTRRDGALGRLPQALAWCYRETGRWSRALAFGNQAAELAQTAGQQYQTCEILTVITSIEAAQGRRDDCLLHARRADKIASELGLRPQQLLARRHVALLDLGEGHLDPAIARYEDLRHLAARWGIAHPFYSPLQDLVEAYARAGATDQARALLPELLALVPGDTNPIPAARAERCKGIADAGTDYDAHFRRALALNSHELGVPIAQEKLHNDPASSRSMARFRATWVTHAPVGCAVTPNRCTLRVPSSITNRT